MNDLKEIKARIYREDKIPVILERLECQYISSESGGGRYVAQLPERFGSSNKRNVLVYNDELLNSRIWSYGIKGDIFTIVSFLAYNIHNEEEAQRNLNQAKRWICEQLGYTEYLKGNYKPREDPVQWLREIRRKRRRVKKLEDVEPNRVIDEKVLDYFKAQPWLPWIKEGIDWQTQVEFGVGFDLETGRVTFPVHNRFGQLIGVKGRTVVGDPMKYIYLYELNKGIELFNLHRALPYIHDKTEVIVFEGAKSVMKAWSFGIRNCVSVEGSDVTDIQIELLRDLGQNVRIVIAFDKDKDESFVKNKFADRIHMRDVYGIFDEYNLLEEHDSPVDQGSGVWISLYNQMKKLRSKEVI